jgi:regulator of nucleoside diphosphate kinase
MDRLNKEMYRKLLLALRAQLRGEVNLLLDTALDVVTMNTTVELRDLDTGELETYTVVYPERADIALNRISVLAPLGTALLGSRAGDVVEVRVPAGRLRIRVEEIHFQPERVGAYHL